MREKDEAIAQEKINESIHWAEKSLEMDNIDEAIKHSTAAIAMSKHLKDLPHLIESAMLRGEILAYTGEYKEALEQYHEVLKILKGEAPIFGSCKDKEAEAICSANIGKICNTLGAIDEAREYFEKSTAITDTMKIPNISRSNHIELGNIYLEMGYIEKALTHFDKALSFSNPNKEGHIDILLNKANAYVDLGYTDKAHFILDEAFLICESHGSESDYCRLLTNRGYIFARDEAWEEALTHFNKALEIAEKMDDRESQALLLTNIGHIYHNLEKYEHAINCYEKSLTIHEDTGSREGQAAVHNGLGIIASEKGDATTALTRYAVAEKLFRDLGYYPQLQLVYQNMGRLFHNTHDNEKSKLDSLRNAQLELLHSKRFKSPFYWAPFVLVDDWR